jgi:poly(A) polymerase
MSIHKQLPESVSKFIPLLVQDAPVWFVGGGVRDHLLGRKTYDLDFAVDGDAITLAKRIADQLGGYYYTLDEARGTGRVVLEDPSGRCRTLDFARIRGRDIIIDLHSRDFTINAMAINLSDPDEWLDPTAGARDLKDKILRACGPHSISDDPVRALRAVRLAIEFDLTIESNTLSQVRDSQQTLGDASPERIRDEVFQIFNTQRPGRALRLLNHLRLLFVLFPELSGLENLTQPPPRAASVLEHSLAVVDRLGDLLAVLQPEHDPEEAANLFLAQITLRIGRFRDRLNHHLNSSLSYGREVRQLVFFAALYHDVGKFTAQGELEEATSFEEHQKIGAEWTERRAREMRLSNKEMLRLGRIVRYQEEPMIIERFTPLSPREIYRYFRNTGEAGIDIVLLSLADFLGTYVPPAPQTAWKTRVEVARTLLEAYFEAHDKYIDPSPLLRGDEIITTLGLPQGPVVGRLIEQLREAQVAGEVRTREEAMVFLSKAAEGMINT